MVKKKKHDNSNLFRMIPIYGKTATLLCIFEILLIRKVLLKISKKNISNSIVKWAKKIKRQLK